MQALVQALELRVTQDRSTGTDLTRIGVQVWGEALRSPALATRADAVHQRLRAHCAAVARRWQEHGDHAGAATPEQVGAAMLSLLQGFVLQRPLMTGSDTAGYVAGVHALLGSPPDQVRAAQGSR